MAAVDTCYKDLMADHRVMDLLVYFLNEHTRSGATAMELAACERVLYRSAMAVTQLSRQKPTAIAFVKLQCKCLSEICIFRVRVLSIVGCQVERLGVQIPIRAV